MYIWQFWMGVFAEHSCMVIGAGSPRSRRVFECDRPESAIFQRNGVVYHYN